MEKTMNALNAWVNHNTRERKKYEKVLLEISSQFLNKKKESSKTEFIFNIPQLHDN